MKGDSEESKEAEQKPEESTEEVKKEEEEKKEEVEEKKEEVEEKKEDVEEKKEEEEENSESTPTTEEVAEEEEEPKPREPVFLLPDYQLIGLIDENKLISGPQRCESRKDCEVYLLVGLPGSGKTYWTSNFIKENPEKKYDIIGPDSLIAKMTVSVLNFWFIIYFSLIFFKMLS